MKKNILTIVALLLGYVAMYSQTQTQNLNMGLYQLQFPSANGGSNRIQSYGGTFPGTWLFKSRFDDIYIDAGENASNKYRILFLTGGIERARINSDGNFGIGTTNPSKKLEIKGGDGVGIRLFNEVANTWDILNTQYGKLDFVRGGVNTFMRIDQFGNVGIGTTNPGKKLEVNGDILLQNSSGIKQIYTWSGSDENWRIGMNDNPGFNRSLVTSHTQFIAYGLNNNQGFAVGRNGEDSSFEIGGTNHTAFFRGNVGIGTTTPGSWKLAVNGNIRAKEVKVETGWSDFVFDNDYDLPTLKEVEQHIKAKGHLKDIPSAKEVAENGIMLGEMDSKLLQKIEELTLYTINQEKRISNLEATNKKLIKILEKLVDGKSEE
ncbi:hypothetical protein [Pontimicrobium sp. SW4]|uniref:Peptidase S74 domain-containing protein n=1 Tax=Pontimicrobium sp. SW4 TaxID=3153519 RepID=A0AAU7BQ29_9FLAO